MFLKADKTNILKIDMTSFSHHSDNDFTIHLNRFRRIMHKKRITAGRWIHTSETEQKANFLGDRKRVFSKRCECARETLSIKTACADHKWSYYPHVPCEPARRTTTKRTVFRTHGVPSTARIILSFRWGMRVF